MKSWVKLYTEINRDPDMGTLTWAQRGIWAALLALAGEIDDRDGDGAETGRLSTPDRVAWHLRLPEAELADCVSALEARQMIATDDDGVLRLVNYGERQARKPSDARERVRARVAKARDGNAPVSRCNADVTPLYRPVSRTDSDSDSDSDSESESDADVVAPQQQQQPAREERPPADSEEGQLFTTLEASGRLPSSMEAQLWLDMLADMGWPLMQACLAEAAKQGKPPSPAYVGAMAQRCKREGVQPGQWANGKPRASPTVVAPPVEDALARYQEIEAERERNG